MSDFHKRDNMSERGGIGSWNVGGMSGGGIAFEAQPFKGFTPSGKVRRGEWYGRRFESASAGFRAMEAYGYSDPHYRRPQAFVTLTLPRRVRRHLHGKSNAYVRSFVLLLCERDGGVGFVRKVFDAPYFREARKQWYHYAQTGEELVLGLRFWAGR